MTNPFGDTPIKSSPFGDTAITEKTAPSFDLESMQEIGSAPELNELSVPAFKASLGLLSTGDEKSLQGIFKSQFGEDVSFEQANGSTVVNLPSGQYVLNKPGLSGQDIARFTAEALAFTPAGRAATIPKAIGASALTETGLEATEQALGGEDISPTEIGLSGFLGGAFKGVENLLGAGYRMLKGKGTEEAKALTEAARQADIPLTTTDVLPPKTFAGRMAQQTGEKIPFIGTGAAKEAQQETREQAVKNVAEKYNQYSYDAIIESLKTQKDKVKGAAGSVLESTGARLDNLGEMPISNTLQAIEEAGEGLSKKGVIRSGSALDDLDTLVTAIKEAPQTFTSLKENRTAFRDILKGMDKAERSQLGSRSKAMLSKVEAAMKKDMSELAKNNLSTQEFAKWNRANQVYFDEATKLTKTRLKNILDKGDITPEKAGTMIFSSTPSEVKTMYNSLTSDGKANARSAIVSKMFDNMAKSGNVSPNAFLSQIRKHQTQIDTFFKGKDKAQLRGLEKALEATRRAQDAAVTSPTGQQTIGIGTALSLFVDPVSTLGAGGTAGGLARIYESGPVKNALIRLASIPKGSTKFESALLDVQTALNAATQSGIQDR